MAGQITITPIPDKVTITAAGTVLGTSRHALELREGSYPPVIYVPREDLDMGLLQRTTRSTTCPWKGAASYYSIRGGERLLDNAVWSYEDPRPEVAQIAGHLAFYDDKVTVTRG